MRIYFIIIASLILLGCSASRIRQPNSPSVPEGTGQGIPIPAVAEKPDDSGIPGVGTSEFLSAETRVKGILNFLASDGLEGRDSGSEGIEKAALFIEAAFRLNGIAPYFTSYRDTLPDYPKPAYNLVGYLEGTDEELKDEFIIIGAHYDHIGVIRPQVGDSIANGANDNASGTTTVLELMRYFGHSRSNKRSLIFALFTAEEKGLLGSAHLANELKSRGMDLYTMLNFEMTGVPLLDKDYFMYVTGYERSNLAEVCNAYGGQNLIGFLPTALEFNLFQRSDNFPFHQVFNVPSQTFCTFDFTNFDHYHKVGDEASGMNYRHMVQVVNRMIPVIEGIANAPQREIKYN